MAPTAAAAAAAAAWLFVLASLAPQAQGHRYEPNTWNTAYSDVPKSRPDDVDVEFDCAWRAGAMEYATHVQPWIKSDQDKIKMLFDALELKTLCNQTLESLEVEVEEEEVGESVASRRSAFAASECDIYVDGLAGSDGASGGRDAPLATLASAVEKARECRSPGQIVLLSGTHYLQDTIVLTQRDNGLRITSESDGNAIVSGGILLKDLKWEPYKEKKGVFVTKIDQELPKGIKALQVEGRRATRARYPNANPEIDLFPKGYITDLSTEWGPPLYNGKVCNPNEFCGPSKTQTISVTDAWHGMYQNYTMGFGGACDRYDPPQSPWCSDSFYLLRQLPEMHARSPSSIKGSQHLPNYPYKNATGAEIHTWRVGHWYSWMFEVGEVRKAKSEPNSDSAGGAQTHSQPDEFVFSKGGHQGGEGADVGWEWWIDNVFEELDAPNEFFFDEVQKLLYLYYNGTNVEEEGPPSSVVVPSHASLIEIRGNQSHPVENIKIEGVGFTASRPTYMEPHGIPSGGDWALQRVGAVLLEGTRNVSISGNEFKRLDATAVFLSGFNRDTKITHNDFAWLGMNGVALWGRTEGNDGRGGDQPRGVTFADNFCYEVGMFQKQSSCYFQAVSAQNRILRNIAFNLPRAAVNFNDGFGGGCEMGENLLFNTCRESSDHGAFNSWDRLPYVTTIRNGSASTVPAWNNMHHNYIVANYAADGGCFDHDDGSAYYDMNHNFCVYGGHKSDFDGHSKVSRNSIHAYPVVYNATCASVGTQKLPPRGYAEKYQGNRCILKPNNVYLEFNDMNVTELNDFNKMEAGFNGGNNTLYVAKGQVPIVKGNKTSLTLQQFQDLGHDKGTKVVEGIPPPKDIIEFALKMLTSASATA